MALLLAVLVVYGGVAFLSGTSFYRFLLPSIQNLSGATTGSHALRALLAAPGNYLRAWRSDAPMETLSLDIRFRHLHEIHEKRAEAMETGILLASGDDLVPATITHRGRTVRVKLRLKGDLTDHLEGDKWSFRVHVRDGDQLFGMRRFSLQAPRTRGYHAEIFPLTHLRAEGVLAPRYFFVDVVVNGKDIGLMAVEEHFSKELLEAQERREGVIVRYDEDPFWRNVVTRQSHGPFDSHRNASIQSFTSSRVAADPKLSADLDVAIGLLRAFGDGTLPASEVFDVELMARFLAVAEIWRSPHPVRWHNLRFYLNPITQRLEPVGFDFNLHLQSQADGLLVEQAVVARAILRDPVIRSAFVRALSRIAAEVADGPVIERMQAIEAEQLAILHREFPHRSSYDFRPVVEGAKVLRTIDDANFDLFARSLRSADRPYATAVHAYILPAAGDTPDGQGAILELVNALPVPVEITELRIAGAPDAAAALEIPLPLLLPPTPFRTAPSPLRIPLPGADAGGVLPAVEGEATALGQRYAIATAPYAAPLARNPVPRSSLEETLARHPFLRHDAADNRLRAVPGRFTVQGSLVLPDGMGLLLPAGTELRFPPGAGLVARGPLEFLGREDAPVVLRGSAADDSKGLWSGVAVLDSARPSRWSHVRILHTGGFDRAGWSLDAGVTFYGGEVHIEHSRFEGNRSEDALNIFRSRFTLHEVEILDTTSDAFDADFTHGEIVGGRIDSVGGDGIDVSGSQVTARGVELSRIRDKAISAGENSRFTASQLLIRDVGTAVASKDRSTVEIEDSRIENVAHTALMAYVKKPEYGPAQLGARNNVITSVRTLAIAQRGSRVVIDGEPVPETDVDVESLYAEGYMRK